jgi:hypothetical protein
MASAVFFLDLKGKVGIATACVKLGNMLTLLVDPFGEKLPG